MSIYNMIVSDGYSLTSYIWYTFRPVFCSYFTCQYKSYIGFTAVSNVLKTLVITFRLKLSLESKV
jgi:hypothetical protein